MIYEGVADITSAFQNIFSNACNILERTYFIHMYATHRMDFVEENEAWTFICFIEMFFFF